MVKWVIRAPSDRSSVDGKDIEVMTMLFRLSSVPQLALGREAGIQDGRGGRYRLGCSLLDPPIPAPGL